MTGRDGIEDGEFFEAMGQAKQRAVAKKQWYETLTASECVIADVAERLFNRFIKPAESTGMCYRMTFFLHLYLADKGVQTVPVVGYINDGSDDVMISHAWLEFGGKKTDLTLGITEDPDLNPVGNVIILDQILFPGLTYTYHLEKSAEGVAIEAQWLQDPKIGPLVRRKEIEHAAMSGRANSPEHMRSFLDAAPDGLDYNKLRAIIDIQGLVAP
ncbi:hypothetical protein LB557_04475 [Mesorhizobium sp. BR115XR7A]|nr:hypothetical protein [Mesorhizobium sp. BR115XR7A]MBZ9931058.1 hypothetical protein [Mesorhizobium sp. BR1-1-5]